MWLACDTARRLGGTPAAQWLAGLCVLANPLFLREPLLPAAAVFERLFLTLGLWGLVRRALDDAWGWWLLVGAALGAGLLRAYAADSPGFGVLAGPGVVVALVGLLRLLRDRAGSGMRLVAVACAIIVGVRFARTGTAADLAPILPVLFGAGASQLSQWGETLWQRRSRWLVHGVSALQLVCGVAFAPMALPLLPPAILERYVEWLRARGVAE